MKSSEPTISSKIVSFIIVLLSIYFIDEFSSLSLVHALFPLRHTSYLLTVFEKHFWQFAVSFSAIVWLSRGHLWSYGINSKNLKMSMNYLLWAYGFTIVSTLGVRIMTGSFILPLPAESFPLGIRNSIIAMLVFWMSAPVANTILFFGFGQTLLMKYFESLDKMFLIPTSVIIAAVFYSLFSTGAHFIGLGSSAWIGTFMIGIFSGYVYWKTESLIAPMLGQAFYFGFPLFVKIVSLVS